MMVTQEFGIAFKLWALSIELTWSRPFGDENAPRPATS